MSRSTWLYALEKLIERAIPSERQSAEWGVRAIKGPLRILTTTLTVNSQTRLHNIALCAHLYNYRVRKVGLNQIRSVYSSDRNSSEPWLNEL